MRKHTTRPTVRADVLLAARLGEPIRDDPDADNTPYAHPAFWRGQDSGIAGAAMRIRRVLDGDDHGAGVLGSAELEDVRRRVIALRDVMTAAIVLKDELARFGVELEELESYGSVRRFCKGCHGSGVLEADPELACDCRANLCDMLEDYTAGQKGAAPCARCGGAAPEFTVPNDAWNTIIRDDGREGPGEYLCLSCFATAAADKIRHLKAESVKLRQHIFSGPQGVIKPKP